MSKEHSFAQAVTKEVKSKKTTTTNGMKARVSTANACVDLFFRAGASRGRDISAQFIAAYQENPEYALRILLWLRDIRGGAGERKLFRDLLLCMEQHAGTIFKEDEVKQVLNKTPEVGRWDDIFFMKEKWTKDYVLDLIEQGVNESNGLLMKWIPREKSANKKFAVEVMTRLGLTPRQYRKMLAANTSVVETPMCANDWDNINFSHVPSKAANLYKTAFYKHTQESGAYKKYVDSLIKGDDPKVKVNASAIFPHDVIKEIVAGGYGYSKQLSSTELRLIQAQWDALPDYMDGQNILPVVDTSSSMFWSDAKIKGTKNLYAGHIAQSLGLYCADKNKGAFKGLIMQFSTNPVMEVFSGSIIEKCTKIQNMHVGGSTNLEGAFENILNTGIKYDVPESEMPKIILIMSDMQFNQSSTPSESAQKMIKRMYSEAGYELPKVVYWNLAAYDNAPVKFDKSGVALVSGYSPSLLKSILKNGYEDFTPLNVMLETIMNERYNLG